MLKKETILGVGITSSSRENILENFLRVVEKDGEKVFLVTPNPEILVYAQKHLDYKDKLNSALIALNDGVGLSIAARIMGKQLGDRFTGVDFIDELCKACENTQKWHLKKPLSMGFVGGRGRVAELTVDCLKTKYPSIDIAFVGEEWPAEAESKKIRPFDILFVAFGAPKQEEWIASRLETLPVKSAIGVGGAFDYYSGKVRRAPKFLRDAGLEWLFRLVVQPWRIKRQTALLLFLLLVLREKYFPYK